MNLVNYILHPQKIIIKLGQLNVIPISDALFLKLQFRDRLKKKLDLRSPKTFNEKLQWLKLYDRKEIYTTMVDKYEVKKYVANIIGEEYIIPTLGVYDNFDEIDFDKLPKQFVMKCTHDSGGIVICKNKEDLNISDAKRKITRSLKRNFYYAGREWPYKNVKPRILIEEYMLDSSTDELRDYKFFVFNGRVQCFKIDFNRFINHQANYYDRDAKLLRFGEAVCPPDFNKELSMPKNLKKMMKLAEKLAGDIPFARIDFYEVNGRVYFGEITFYPAAGFGEFVPEIWDKKLGDLIDLGLTGK